MSSTLSWLDWVLLVATFLISVIIGLYYGFMKRKQNNTVEDILLANRQAKFFPVAISNYVSWSSAISFLADPNETYMKGGVAIWSAIGQAVGCIFAVIYIVPIFHDMKIISIFSVSKLLLNKK